MNELIKRIFENNEPEEISNMLINLNKFQLNRKEHIKKYNRIRKLHSEIIDSMDSYLETGKYDINKYFNLISYDIQKETKGLNIDLDFYHKDDRTILEELFIYKNNAKIPCLTEIYLEKNKFRNKDKVNMLQSMKDSHASLFKVIDTNRNEGYVIYEDVFTGKKYQVIDIAMSSTLQIDQKKIIYVYNRIITIDGICFATGIHCMMSSEHPRLKEFIKKHKYNQCSNFSRCLLLYNLSKQDNKISVNYNNQYGNKR